MNVFERNEALDQLLDAHAAGRISNENLRLGTNMVCDLYDAQPDAAKSDWKASPRIISTRFTDSIEATDFVYAVEKMLQDPRLEQWVQATDDNYGTTAAQDLANARASYIALLLKLETAC